LRVAGYGSARPLCNEASPASSDMSLEDCRQLNRSTRIAVFGK
jgi:outer membrane protein OmpA-like peptidoglycan-associated protein